MKSTFLSFNQGKCLLLILFFATFISCENFNNNTAKKDRTITITDTSINGKDLIMSDKGHSKDVEKNTKVIWKVKQGLKISITRIYKKPNSPEIFDKEPTADDKMFSATVTKDPGVDYLYNIEWKKDGDTTRKTYDPKISVKPTKKISPLQWLIGILLGLATLFFGFYLIRIKKKEKGPESYS